MGLLSNIKKVYDKVDSKLGGYLPGGQTPSQVSAVNKPAPISVPFQPYSPNNGVAQIDKAIATPSVGPAPTSNAGIPVNNGRTTSSSNRTPISVPNTPYSPTNGIAQIDQAIAQPTPTNVQPGGVPVQSGPSQGSQQISSGGSAPTSSLQDQTLKEKFMQTGAFKALNTYFDPNNPVNKFLGAGQQSIDPVTGQPVYNTAPTGIPGANFATAAVVNLEKIVATQAAIALEKKAAADVARLTGQQIVTKLENKGADILAGKVGQEVVEAAAGKTATTVAGQAATNTATYATRLSFIKSIATKHPAMVVGAVATWLTTGVMAFNELNDDIQSLSFKASDAVKAGDFETAQEFTDRIAELDKLNSYGYVLGGPFFYLYTATQKGADAVTSSQKTIDVAKEKQITDKAFEDRYNAGNADQADIDAYILANPYSAIAQIEKSKEVAAAKEANTEADPNTPYGTIGPNGEYIPSRYELAKRLESQNYYNSLQGNTATTENTYQAPSSLNFGLLRTSGGYETVKKDASNAGQLVTDTNTISDYYFGIPYNQLTPAQKQLIDMMASG